MVFHLSTLYVLRSDQYFCLVPAIYESILLEHINKFVVEPIDNILTFSMFEEIYWTFSNSVGKLLEPSLCHHEVYVLDVGSDFLSLVHVQLLKDVAVNSRRIFLVSSESSRIGHACADYSWDVRLLPPSSWKFLICTTSHWLIYSRMRKSPRPSLSYFMFPNKISVVFHCNKLLLV
jgi:hypothetical protein